MTIVRGACALRKLRTSNLRARINLGRQLNTKCNWSMSQSFVARGIFTGYAIEDRNYGINSSRCIITGISSFVSSIFSNKSTKSKYNGNFKNFEDYSAEHYSLYDNIPIKNQLHQYFNMSATDEESETIVDAYLDWRQEYRKEVLDQQATLRHHLNTYDIAPLMKENWSQRTTVGRITTGRLAIAMTAPSYHKLYDLGKVGIQELYLEVMDPSDVPYFEPDNPKDGNTPCSKDYILRTNIDLIVPDTVAEGIAHMHSSSTPAYGGSSTPLRQSGLWMVTKSPRRSVSSTTTAPPFAYPLTITNDNAHCSTLATTTKSDLSSFQTKFVNLGMVVASPGEEVDTPYACVAALDDAGDVIGMFAFPVDGPKGGEYIDEEFGIKAWEPDVRGVYYLGKDFDDAAKREWQLTKKLGDSVVEVIRNQEEVD